MAKNFFENIDYNTVLLESDNFVVIPSLGALIEGWLLIVPKSFVINLAQLSEELLLEMNYLINKIEKEFLQSFGDSYVLFEHGPNSFLSKAGCGVDYAHLHFVPCSFDLKKGLEIFLNLDYSWEQIGELKNLMSLKDVGTDYLFLRDQNSNFYFTAQDNIQSQTFRKVIASYLNQPDRFDWKSYHNSENIRATITKLKPILA